MRRADRTIRVSSLAATATTLAALVAVAAAAPASRGLSPFRSGHAEVAALGETRTIRVVAAVVAAAARDLLAAQTTTAICPGAFPIAAADVSLPSARVRPALLRPADSLLPAERLIDLPPPVC